MSCNIRYQQISLAWSLPACDVLIQTVKTEGISCEFKRVDGYLFPHSDSKEDMEKIDKELDAANRAGLKGVHKVRLHD